MCGRTFLLVLLAFLPTSHFAFGQAVTTPLEAGTPIERTLTANQSHSYTISLDKDQLVDLIVDQRGIDVVVRVFVPSGRLLREFDTPNGDQGPENVEFVASTSGTYRIEVAPLSPNENPPPGRYEIKLTDVRKATAEELQAANNEEVRKTKALALLAETVQTFDQLRRPQTRADIEMRAAGLFWKSDEKRAANLMAQAMESVKEFIAEIDEAEDEYYEANQTAWQLRQQLVETLAPHDPAAALDFLRATHSLKNPYALQRGQPDQELQLELLLVNRSIDSNPKEAFRLAEDSLKRGSSTSLIETLSRLQSKDTDLAAALAHDIARKLSDQQLLQTPEAAYLAGSFLHVTRLSPARRMNDGDGPARAGLLSEDEFRELFLKVLAEVLAYTPPANNVSSPERELAQSLANTLKQLTPELQSYAPDRAEALDKKSAELFGGTLIQANTWQIYQDAINKSPVETALESVSQAPPQMRDQLYQQVAAKIAASGDLPRATQLLADHIANPMQRQQALRNLDQQAIYEAARKGRFDEAFKLLSTVRPLSARSPLIQQVLDQMNGGLKRATAIAYLDQAKTLVGSTVHADDQAQMNALLAIARAFARYDLNRAAEILNPLIDQFNDMTVAATTLDGFGQKYYRDGELINTNGNALSEIANQLSTTLAALSTIDFDQAKNSAARIRPVDVRTRIFLGLVERNLATNEQSYNRLQ